LYSRKQGPKAEGICVQGNLCSSAPWIRCRHRLRQFIGRNLFWLRPMSVETPWYFDTDFFSESCLFIACEKKPRTFAEVYFFIIIKHTVKRKARHGERCVLTSHFFRAIKNVPRPLVCHRPFACGEVFCPGLLSRFDCKDQDLLEPIACRHAAESPIWAPYFRLG
jgi:hypothetical protein